MLTLGTNKDSLLKKLKEDQNYEVVKRDEEEGSIVTLWMSTAMTSPAYKHSY